MPGGPAPLGFAYFVATKFVGYSLFCRCVIQPRWQQLQTEAIHPTSALLAGAARTAIGVAFGATVGLGFWEIPIFQNGGVFSTTLFFLILVPIRYLEWRILLRWIYEDLVLKQATPRGLIAWGIVSSFGLDLVGVLCAMILPGGIWVC